MAKVKITSRKYQGDDKYSWAVFRSDKPYYPCFTGLSRFEIPHYKKMVQEIIDNEKELRNENPNLSFSRQ